MFKKTLTGLIAGIMCTALSVAPAFASTTITDGKGTVPVYLTVAATPVDVTIGTDVTPDENPTDPDNPVKVPITDVDLDGDGNPDTLYGPEADAIYMAAAANSNVASVSPLKVRNNNASAPVYVKGIIVNNVTSGYTLASYADDFATKQADSKEFGIALTGSSGLTPAADISTTDLKTGYTSTGDQIAASAVGTYNLGGKVAVVTSAIAQWQKVADCVVTVAMTPMAQG